MPRRKDWLVPGPPVGAPVFPGLRGGTRSHAAARFPSSVSSRAGPRPGPPAGGPRAPLPLLVRVHRADQVGPLHRLRRRVAHRPRGQGRWRTRRAAQGGVTPSPVRRTVSCHPGLGRDDAGARAGRRSGSTDPDAVTVVETRAVRGSIAYGVAAETREPITFTAEAATLRDFALALEEGIPYVVALVPAWGRAARHRRGPAPVLRSRHREAMTPMCTVASVSSQRDPLGRRAGPAPHEPGPLAAVPTSARLPSWEARGRPPSVGECSSWMGAGVNIQGA